VKSKKGKTKVLVAGASGKLGQQVINELKKQGFWVRALARKPEKLADNSADEVFKADITDAALLKKSGQEIDLVISCAGAAMNVDDWKNKQTFTEVDYEGNLNLLREAQKSGVKKFVYVSLMGGENLRQTEYADAHEHFVEALKESGIDYTVVRPTGFFSFYLQILEFAKKGRGLVIGDGSCRTNPIHDADVAKACIEALSSTEKELAVGGKETFTRQEITELAFEALGQKPKLMRVPPGIFKAMIFPIRLFNRRIYALMDFGVAVTQSDCVAPEFGEKSLRDFFAEKAKNA
jgi:uncharacterized protein YbjT (DUF2867 family)